MRRILTSGLLLFGLVVLVQAELSAAPAKKPAAAPSSDVVAGTIKAVARDGKAITIEVPAVGKKEPARTRQIKITDTTKIEYVGIDKEEDRKLKVGYTA